MISKGWMTNCLLAGLVLATSCRLNAAIITVTTTSDDIADGDGCSVREAILAANADVAQNECPAGDGKDTIAFAIPGPGPHRIVVAAHLPPIVAPVDIDGTTQPGSFCPYGQQIEIDDGIPGLPISGLDYAFWFLDGASGSSLRGLRIVGFESLKFSGGIGGYGIDLTEVDGFVLQCNVIGNAYGIAATGDNLLIGTDGDGERDSEESNWFFSYNSIGFENETGNIGQIRIAGNRIGEPPDGYETPLSRNLGITISGSPNNVVIGTDDADNRETMGNVIDAAVGILLYAYYGGADSDIIVSGNWVGVHPDGHFFSQTNTPLMVYYDHRFAFNATVRIGADSDRFAGNVFSGTGFENLPYAAVFSTATEVDLSVVGNLFVAQPSRPTVAVAGVAIDSVFPIDFSNNLMSGWDIGVIQPVSGRGVTGDASGNCIMGNRIGAQGADNLELVGNWWGSPDGPGGAGPGRGDPVNAEVVYAPILSHRPPSCDLRRFAPRGIAEIPILGESGRLVLLLLIVMVAAIALRQTRRYSS